MMGIRRFHVQWLFAKTYYNYADVSVFFYSRLRAASQPR